MTDTTRDLIQRMARELDLYRQLLRDNCTSTHPLADEARDYLAQPEPEGLTDEPLGDLIDKWVQEAFRKKPYGCKHPTHTYVACKAFEQGRNHAARTALSQPEPQAPSKHELFALLMQCGGATRCVSIEWLEPFARAVLARWPLAAIKPVPASERLPGPEDCMDEGWAWFYTPRGDWIKAVLPVSPAYTHWLPHYALPIPPATEKP